MPWWKHPDSYLLYVVCAIINAFCAFLCWQSGRMGWVIYNGFLLLFDGIAAAITYSLRNQRKAERRQHLIRLTTGEE